jgi:hypothetical protein
MKALASVDFAIDAAFAPLKATDKKRQRPS